MNNLGFQKNVMKKNIYIHSFFYIILQCKLYTIDLHGNNKIEKFAK